MKNPKKGSNNRPNAKAKHSLPLPPCAGCGKTDCGLYLSGWLAGLCMTCADVKKASSTGLPTNYMWSHK